MIPLAVGKERRGLIRFHQLFEVARALGEEKLQTFAAKHLLHHRTGGRNGLAQFETIGGGTTLKLCRGIHILVVEVEDVGDGGQGLIGGRTKTDGHLVEVLHLHAENLVSTKEVGDASQTEVVAEGVGLICVLIGEDAVVTVVGLGLAHFYPHTGGLFFLCQDCAAGQDGGKREQGGTADALADSLVDE